MFGEHALVPDVGHGEERETEAFLVDDQRAIGLLAVPARADVLDPDALEVVERLEERLLAVVPRVVVRQGDDVEARPREDVGALGRADEDEDVVRRPDR
jgi:hypothetical protein